MVTYTFIKSTDSENYPNPILAISTKIKELELHETYDRFGQLIGHDIAADYSIYNKDSGADWKCLKELIEHFQITSKANDTLINTVFINSDGEIEITLNIEEQDIENFDRAKINAFIKKWEEKNADYNTVKGFNYWDGQNWKTVVVEDYIWDNPTHEIIENDSLKSEIDSKEWIKDGFGKMLYESENYWIIHNYCEGSFSAYELYAKEEYDLENIF